MSALAAALCWSPTRLTPGNAQHVQVTQQRTFSQPGRDDVATSLVLDHNTLLARTRLTGAIYGGPDRAYKAVVHLDSLTVRLQVSRCPCDRR